MAYAARTLAVLIIYTTCRSPIQLLELVWFHIYLILLGVVRLSNILFSGRSWASTLGLENNQALGPTCEIAEYKSTQKDVASRSRLPCQTLKSRVTAAVSQRVSVPTRW